MRIKPAVVLAAVAALTAGMATAPTATSAPTSRSIPKGTKHSAAHSSKPQAAGTGIGAAATTTALTAYRFSGPDRFATAVEVSKASFPTGVWTDGSSVETVTIANGDDFPDALAGGPFAAWLGPLLLVPHDGTVPPVVVNEIQRLKPADIVILGGPGAVSAAIESQLAALVPAVFRVAGVDRYDTAAQVAVATNEDWTQSPPDNTGVDGVYVANGQTFADSLAGGGAAAVNKGALVLTDLNSLPAATAAALKTINPPHIYVLGGPGAVSDAVVTQIQGLGLAGTVQRLAGASRYETAIAISTALFPGAESVALVNANNFPDALAAAPFDAITGASSLLTSGPCVTAGTAAETSRLGATSVLAIGGQAVVSDAASQMTVC